VAPAPAGIWTSINWLAVPGGHSPKVTLPPRDSWALNAYIGGWSKGFVEFLWNNNLRTLTPWVSADGLNWSAGGKMDISVWSSDFKKFDAEVEPSERGQCFVRVGTFLEGPANLLVSATVDCFSGDRCAGVDSPITANLGWWTSADGVTWGPVPRVSDIRDGVVVSGGSSGYIRYDYGKLSTSANGKSWQGGTLPSLPAGSTVSQPIAMSGGYVLPTVMRVKAGHQTPQEGCLGYTDLSQYEGALWWSPDGTNWTRATINSFARYSPGVRMEVYRVDDHTAVGIESEGSSVREWVSSDGRNWTQMKTVLIEPDSDHLICGRDHGLVATADYKMFFGFDAGRTLKALKQTGSAPWIDQWQIVIGPTGLLVTQDGTRFWLGVPGAA
jgi:hypothetical protein